MQNLTRLALPILTLVALSLRVANAEDTEPVITFSEASPRVVARYGIAEDAYRQSQMAVKQLSFLIKKYPNAKSWAVAYNTDPYDWRVIEYGIGRRQLTEIKSSSSGKGKSWGYDYFPAHIHRAAQQSLGIEKLWDSKKPRKP